MVNSVNQWLSQQSERSDAANMKLFESMKELDNSLEGVGLPKAENMLNELLPVVSVVLSDVAALPMASLVGVVSWAGNTILSSVQNHISARLPVSA